MRVIFSIKDARHHGIENSMQICEWVPFCTKLNEGSGNIFINPKFINQKNKTNIHHDNFR